MSVTALIQELDERNIARAVTLEHDAIRGAYTLDRNTVSSHEEFIAVIADYYNEHFSRAVSHGGRLSRAEAAGRAQDLIEKELRRRGGNLLSAYHACLDGVDGGLRRVLDIIAEGLKAEAVENYIRHVFRTYVDPSSWEERVELIRSFFDTCGGQLSAFIQTDQPSRYANDYELIIREYANALQRTSAAFRRM